MKRKVNFIKALSAIIFCVVCVTACRLSPVNVSATIKGEAVFLEYGSRTIQFYTYEGGAIEVVHNEKHFNTLPSFAAAETAKRTTPKLEVGNKVITIGSDDLVAEFDKSSLDIRFYRNGKLLTTQKNVFFEPSLRGVEFSLNANEKIIGGGQRVLGMDRRGHRMPLYNRAHYGYTTESNQMYYSLPAIMSSDKYTIAFDNTASGFLDIGKTDSDILRFEAVSGRNGYFIFSDDSFPELIHDYVRVTGKQPLPAIWTFGNHASRFGYHTQEEVLSTIQKFEEEDFPVDSIILDLYWFGPDVKGHVGNLAWDKKAFPDPDTMIETLKAKGVKTILITEPFVLTTSKRWQEAVDKEICAKDEKGEPKRFDFYFGNTCLIDVFDDRARDWFWNIYKGLLEQGVAGSWGDLGEPEVHPDDSLHFLSDTEQTVRGDAIHNAFGHEWAKLVYTNQRELQPDVRPLIMMRSGFLGSQRYGMIPWTGDVSRSWEGLQPQVELSLQMGLMGLAYTHSDLGGFAGGENFDKEMYIRWLQYGVFQPVYRPHAQEHIAPEPVFHDDETKDITREYVKLRYQLLPYHYTMAYENSTTGMPLMRPLFFADDGNAAVFERTDGYFWGDAFFVKPIVRANANQQIVELPKGVWFDFWDGSRYEGRQVIEKNYSLEKIPVFVKAGAFIPMIDTISNTESYSTENITLHYYADASISESKGMLYDDDGKSFGNIEKRRYDLLTFKANHKDNSLSVAFSKSGEGFSSAPKKRAITLVIYQWLTEPDSVMLDGEAVTFHYEEKKGQLRASIEWKGSNSQLIVK